MMPTSSRAEQHARVEDNPLDIQSALVVALARLRRAGTDLQTVEVKAAAGNLPKTTAETVSAFANGSGGLLVLGLSEELGFSPVDIDAAKLAADLASCCSDQLEPAVRPEIDICLVDGRQVVVAVIDELDVARKPCFIRKRGMEGGAFRRTHDGDRRLTTYEIHVLLSSRGQPHEDMSVVERADMSHLDPDRVAALLKRVRQRKPSAFGRADDTESLLRLGVLTETDDRLGVTLAGLLALGVYPQQFLPQLNVTFVAYSSRSGESVEGRRFEDNVSIDGSIPSMLADAMAALRRNMKSRAVIMGVGREDRWEYPEEAIRELIANALMHRDYHSLAQGMQISLSQYPDRLEISSPGGLFGPVDKEGLLTENVTSSRNGRLAKLLEDVQGEDDRTVCENRGSGLINAVAALRRAGMEPPELRPGLASFAIVLGNQTLLDDEALSWIESLGNEDITDRQKLGLSLLKRRGNITNRIYRTATGCDSSTATRELSNLAERGLIERIGETRAATWYLTEVVPAAMRQEFLPLLERDVPLPPLRRDRRVEIEAYLERGPAGSCDIANHLGLKRGAVLVWLRRLEAQGRVEPTTNNRRSPKLRWRRARTG